MKFGNYKKILGLLLILFCLTGCSVDYDVVIDDYGVVTEVVTIKETNSVMEAINPSVTSFLKNFYAIYGYNTTLNEYEKVEEIGSSESGYIFTRNYSTIELYTRNSYFLNNVYSDVLYNVEGNIVTISGGSFIGYNYFSETINNVENNIKEITASIQIPYLMLNNTAHSSIDSTYNYLYNKDNKSNELLFEFNVTKEYKPASLFDIRGEYLILGFYVICIVVLIMFVCYFNNKHNKI